MKKSIKVAPKKRRGRPATGKDPHVAARMSPVLIAKVEDWAGSQADTPTRSEAIRRLVELGLTVKAKSKQAAGAVRAKELANKTIDKMIDPSAPPEERAQRRRRITAGPSEFREDRVDLPKAKK